MGLDTDAQLSIGYTIDLDLIPAQYLKLVPRPVRRAKRHRSQTRQKLAPPEEVVGPATIEVWILNGKEFEDVSAFLDAVAHTVGGVHGEYGDLVNDPTEGRLHRIELRVPPRQTSGHDVQLAWLGRQVEAVRQLGHQLERLGFEIDPPTAAAYLVII